MAVRVGGDGGGEGGGEGGGDGGGGDGAGEMEVVERVVAMGRR